jgi:hypothetical protein
MAFIHTELDTGITFAQVARTERNTGNEERCQRNIGLARQAYAEARRRIDVCERGHAPESFDSAQHKSTTLMALINALI